MNESREFRGYWWLPDKKEDGASGIAHYSPEEGIELDLFSTLREEEDMESAFSSSTPRHKTIFGLSADGDSITLVDCLQSNLQGHLGKEIETATAKYSAEELLLNGHLTKEERKFDKLRCDYSILDEWSGISGIRFSEDVFSQSQPVSAGDSFEISYEFPEDKTAKLDDITLKIVTTAGISANRRSGASINEQTYFNIIPNKGQISHEDVSKNVKYLQDFLTLATGEATFPTNIYGKRAIEDGDPTPDIEILYHWSSSSDVRESLHGGKVKFTFDDIEDIFSQLMGNWYEKREYYDDIFNNYFGYIYSDDQYIHSQFLDLIRGIRAYIRMKYDVHYLSENEFNTFRQEILDSTESTVDNREFIDHIEKNILSQVNTYSIHKEFEVLYEDYSEIFNSLSWDFEECIDEIVSIHDYYTAYEETHPIVTDTDALFSYRQMLQAVLEIILLREISIPQDQIIEKISQQYQEVI